MAEFSRVTSDGWEHGDDSATYSRVTSEGWEHFVTAAAPPTERIMSSLTRHGGLAGSGGIAGIGGGLAG